MGEIAACVNTERNRREVRERGPEKEGTREEQGTWEIVGSGWRD
jgi:hypothetical protein